LNTRTADLGDDEREQDSSNNEAEALRPRFQHRGTRPLEYGVKRRAT
jgi:hypothetical protein